MLPSASSAVGAHAARRRLAAAVVLLVAVVGLGLMTQGWRSRIPTFDNLGYIDSAQQLVTTGRWPDRGILTSFGSYTPPGTAWLMLPGVVLFDDPRLYELPGSGLLYIGTLVGIFVLADLYFGVPSAVLAVVVYGLSTLGLATTNSLWPRYPLPFFYVWMVYCVSLWVARRNASYLAAALILLAVGLYVFLEMAPAVFVLPAVWLLYRPPVTAKPLLTAGVVALIVWFPYLRFESTRDFIDVKSQVRREVIVPPHDRSTWCNPQLLLRALDEPNSMQDDRMSSADAGWWSGKSWQAAIGNFQYRDKNAATAVMLMILVLLSACVLSLSAPFTEPSLERVRLRAYWLPRAGAGLIVFGALANEFIASRYLSSDGILAPSTTLTIRLFQTAVVISGIGLLLRKKISPVVDILKGRVLAALDNRSSSFARFMRYVVTGLKAIRQGNAQVIVLSMVVPWLMLFLIIEHAGRVDRLWWIWPLQAILLAASVVYIPTILRIPKFVRYAGATILVLLVADPRIGSAIEAWARVGWAGPDAEEVKVVEYVASQLDDQPQAAIGYQEYIWRFMAEYHVMDPRYKVGAEFDVLFAHLHGVSNTNTCAEGVSGADEFRIVQTRHQWTDLTAKGFIDVPRDPRFGLVHQIGSYQVLKRF